MCAPNQHNARGLPRPTLHMHARTHASIRTRAPTKPHTHADTHPPNSAHTHTNVRAHPHLHACLHACLHASTRARTRALTPALHHHASACLICAPSTRTAELHARALKRRFVERCQAKRCRAERCCAGSIAARSAATELAATQPAVPARRQLLLVAAMPAGGSASRGQLRSAGCSAGGLASLLPAAVDEYRFWMRPMRRFAAFGLLWHCAVCGRLRGGAAAAAIWHLSSNVFISLCTS